MPFLSRLSAECGVSLMSYVGLWRCEVACGLVIDLELKSSLEGDTQIQFVASIERRLIESTVEFVSDATPTQL